MQELSAQEKELLISLINNNKPLPDKYRFLLFENKYTPELVWENKNNEIYDTVLPFQILEQVNFQSTNTELHSKEKSSGSTSWINKLFMGGESYLTNENGLIFAYKTLCKKNQIVQNVPRQIFPGMEKLKVNSVINVKIANINIPESHLVDVRPLTRRLL